MTAALGCFIVTCCCFDAALRPCLQGTILPSTAETREAGVRVTSDLFKQGVLSTAIALAAFKAHFSSYRWLQPTASSANIKSWCEILHVSITVPKLEVCQSLYQILKCRQHSCLWFMEHPTAYTRRSQWLAKRQNFNELRRK